MSTPATQLLVRFVVTFDYARYYSEEEVSRPGGARDRTARTTDLEGAVEIETPAGPVRIVDALVPWIQNLCYGAVPALAAGRPVHIDYAVMPGAIVVTPDSNWINLAGDRIPPVKVPARAFLEALVACADRFVIFANDVKGHDRDYLAQLADMPALARAAKAALVD
ncbi:MAG: hypothetical protein WA840_12650 [Caulobacteraceae bacterium]